MTNVEITSITLSSIFLTFALVGSGILIWKLKLGNKNHVLLFILFIVYWMAPLMCREYTGQMHIHMPIDDGGMMLWIPLAVYGIVGIFWRPLTDILSYKLKSRKNVIYISLLVQALTLWPMFIWQNMATNIIQSIGTGIGASAIGLFNLMFSEQHHHRKIFVTVSILAIPPLIAEFVTSCIEAVLCSCIPNHDEQPTVYLDYLKWVWLLAIIFVAISFVLAYFFKEERHLIFKDLEYKEPVKTKHNKQVVALVCVAGGIFAFMRWVSAGPSSITQLIYIGVFADKYNPLTPTQREIEVKYFEGYLSLVFAIGQLVGAIIAGLILSKHTNKMKWILVGSGATIWVGYLLTNSLVIDAHLFFWSNMFNGLGYGLIYPVLLGIMLSKFFTNNKLITPIGIFNTSMAGGILIGSIFNNVIKGRLYDFHHTPETSTYQIFQRDNWIVNGVTMGLIAIMVGLFVWSYLIEYKYPPQKAYVGKQFAATGESEI